VSTPILNHLRPLNLCNPASFFMKKDHTTWRNERTKMKEGTNKNNTLDYILTLSSDKKFVRNSEASTAFTCTSSDHTCVTLSYKLPLPFQTTRNPKKNTNKKPKTKRTCKRNLLPEDPKILEAFNIKTKALITTLQSQNENESLDQPTLIKILEEASNVAI
jgi:hypothetical protein